MTKDEQIKALIEALQPIVDCYGMGQPACQFVSNAHDFIMEARDVLARVKATKGEDAANARLKDALRAMTKLAEVGAMSAPENVYIGLKRKINAAFALLDEVDQQEAAR